MHEPPDRPETPSFDPYQPNPPEPLGTGFTAPMSAARPERAPDAGTRGRAGFYGLLAVLLVLVVAVVQRLPEIKPKTKAPSAQSAVQLEGSDEVAILGRLLVKFAHALPAEDRSAMNMSLSQIDVAARTPLDRLRAAVVYGELVGADEALKHLKKVEGEAGAAPAESAPASKADGAAEKTPPDLAPDVEALELIYAGKSSELTKEQRDTLITRHGWFAKVALSFGMPDTDPARAPLLAGGAGVIALFVLFGLVFLAATLAGFILCITAIAMFSSRRLRPRFVAPAPGGSVFLETFVVFLGSFLGLALVGALLGMVMPEGSVWLGVGILAAHWLLFLALLYPLKRGVTWPALRASIGWTAGRGVFAEVGAGIVGYLAGLPIFFVGVLIALVAFWVQSLITGVHKAPENPLFERLAQGGPLMLLMFFVMATVWAPIVEEGVFRGCLYRHLRGRLHPILAGMGSAFAFGIIHPVPLVLTVPLMALGFNFAMIREWRGSIIGPMTAHCLHNATVLGLLLSVLSLVGD